MLSVSTFFFLRYKSLVGLQELPAANGENCILLLSKLCPLRPGVFHVGVTKVMQMKKKRLIMFPGHTNVWTDRFCVQLFLKEDVYQLLECKRDRSRELAALTLQRYVRMFFVRKRFIDFRKKMIRFQGRCRGFLLR